MDILIKEPLKEQPFQTMHTALIRSDKLTPIEWRIYCVLNSFNGCKRIFPSQKTIAKKAGNISLPTVIKAIEKLEELGLVIKKKQVLDNNRDSTCEYNLIDYLLWAKQKKIDYDINNDIDPNADIKYISNGYITMQNRFIFCEDLNSNELRIYCDLLTYRYKGIINPSVNTIAADCNLSKRTVFNSVAELENKRLIKRDGQVNEEKGNALLSNQYTIYNYIEWMDKKPI